MEERESVEHYKIILTGKNGCRPTVIKICSSVILTTTNQSRTGMASNTDLRRGTMETNCLTHGIVFNSACYIPGY